MKISDVLWKAANEEMWHGNSKKTTEYSCLAVLHAAGKYQEWVNSDRRSMSDFSKHHCPALTFLEELDCETDAYQFFEFEEDKERQGARYLWLMFAYLVALDEGL